MRYLGLYFLLLPNLLTATDARPPRLDLKSTGVVEDSSGSDWSFGSPLASTSHTPVPEYVFTSAATCMGIRRVERFVTDLCAAQDFKPTTVKSRSLEEHQCPVRNKRRWSHVLGFSR